MSAKLYRCPKCGEERPKDRYFRDARVKIGVRLHECKDCYNARMRKKRGVVPAPEPLPRSTVQAFTDWITGRNRK